MKKNIGTQEAYVRITVAVLSLLLALFVVESSTGKILLATIAAILAGTAFLRTCPINTLIKRNTYDEMIDATVTPPQQTEDVQETETQASDSTAEEETEIGIQ